MGCGSSTRGGGEVAADGGEGAANDEVEQQLLRDKLESLFNFKVLLLGAGESGKSTVVKQLRLIHHKKPSKQELVHIGDSLHQNVIDCMKALIGACQKFDIPIDDDADLKTIEAIKAYDDGRRISYALGEQITQLYGSPAIKAAYKRRSEFWLLDSCDYYLKHLDRFCEIGFVPTEEDTVMARIRTTGIVVSQLEQKLPSPVEGEPDTVKFQVVDVGGQRNERKKWIHCFDDVKAILFVENLAGYNQVLFEDTTKNRMKESLELFHEITHNPMFKSTPIFLFLNKKDLFEQLIQEVDLSVTFPEYSGGPNVNNSLEFVQNLFRQELPPKKEVMILTVTGVWKRDIKCAFDDVKKALMDANRKLIDEEKAKIKRATRRIENKSKGPRFRGGCCSSDVSP